MKKLLLAFVILVNGSLYAQPDRMIDSIRNLAAAHKEDTTLVKLYLDLAKQYQSKNDIENAIGAAEKSTSLAKKLKYYRGQFNGIEFLANISLMTGGFDNARKYVKDALQITNERKDNSGSTRIYFIWAKIEYANARLDTAIILANKSLEASLSVKDSLMMSKAFAILAICNQGKSDFKKANEYNLKGLQIAEQIGDTLLPSVFLGNLGVINQTIGNARNAIPYHLKALKLRIRYKQLRDEIGTYLNLAICYNTLQMPDSGLYYNHLAFAKSAENNLVPITATAAHNIASSYQIKNTDSALHYLNIAIEQFKLLEDEDNLSACYHTQGEIYYTLAAAASGKQKENYIHKAISGFQASLNITLRTGKKEFTVESYRALAECYHILNQHEKAFAYMRSHVLLNDSIRSEEISRQVSEMQTKYETEKKDREIAENKLQIQQNEMALTKKSNANRMIITCVLLLLLVSTFAFFSFRRRKKKEAEEMMLKSRLNISQGLHDDIGSTLSSISVYSQVAQKLSEKNDRQELKEMLGKISATSNEMVSEMNDIVWAINPKNDRIEKMIQRMESFASPLLATRNIHFRLDFSPAILTTGISMEKRKNIYLIFKEAVNNAFKYSGCKELAVHLTVQNQEIEMVIKDDGVGFDVQRELAGERSSLSGNGLGNMHIRANEMNGQLTLDSQPGKGTIIRLLVPIP